MVQVIADKRDIEFVLYEQLDTSDVTSSEKYQSIDRKLMDMIISEARELGIKELLPTYMDGDRQGVVLENGSIKVPECYHRAHNLIREGEWIDLLGDPEAGGQGLPHLFSLPVYEYLAGANYHLYVYSHMGYSVSHMIEAYGSDLLKSLFLKKLRTAEWTGTMLLTEPDAGSDLGNITATAKPNEDGTYSIEAGKIFITVGEHDLAPNIVHPVLARVEGAPKGTAGISIFLVPKIWVNEDGSLGDPNDIVCSGLEEKMGLHGMSTCTMTLGAKGRCKGYLMGNLNQGMKIMFHMMNEARMGIGQQGFIHASTAYLHALNYARQRVQGKDLLAGNNPDAPSVPIIEHPDVRRMLMDMRAYVNGMRSLIYYSGLCFDLAKVAKTDEGKAYYNGITDLITPVIKAYCSDHGFDVCVQAMQVFGGYGYTKEYPVELLTRDCKIASIYEGTNGIQSIDFLGRKITTQKGGLVKNLIREIQCFLKTAKETQEVASLAADFENALEKWRTTIVHLTGMMASKQLKTSFAFSYPILDVTGDILIAWMLLWRAATASKKLSGKPVKKDVSFYHGQIKTAQHFIYTKLPVTVGKMEAILIGNDAALSMEEVSFGS